MIAPEDHGDEELEQLFEQVFEPGHGNEAELHSTTTGSSQRDMPADYLSSSSSPGNWSPSSSSSSSSNPQIEVYQKRRGTGGQWEKLERGALVRVTKGKGKALKVSVFANVEWTELEVTGWDIETDLESVKGLSVSPAVVRTSHGVDLDVMLSRMSRQMRLCVHLKRPGAAAIFSAQDNGKVEKAKAAKPPALALGELMADAGAQGPEKKRTRSDGGDRMLFLGDEEGEVRAQAFLQYSDIRLKTNIKDITDALATVQQLQGHTYQWRPNVIFASSNSQKEGQRVIGMIAQEVQRVLPGLVHEDPATGYLSVNYTDLVPILLEAIKQLQAAQQADSAQLQKQINDLNKKLDALSVVPPPLPPAATPALPASPPLSVSSPPVASAMPSPPPLRLPSSSESWLPAAQPMPIPASIPSSSPPFLVVASHPTPYPEDWLPSQGRFVQWAATAIRKRVAEKIKTLSDALGTPLVFALIWPKKDLPAVTMSLRVEKATGGGAPVPFGQDRNGWGVSVQAFRGNAEGVYRVAVDFNAAIPLSTLLTAVPHIFVYDFRDPLRSPPGSAQIIDVWWLRHVPVPVRNSATARAWVVGEFQCYEKGGAWTKCTNAVTTAMPPSLSLSPVAAPRAPIPVVPASPAPATAPGASDDFVLL